MQIKSNDTLVHLDGEPKVLANPITIKTRANTLKIFSPNEKK